MDDGLRVRRPPGGAAKAEEEALPNCWRPGAGHRTMAGHRSRTPDPPDTTPPRPRAGSAAEEKRCPHHGPVASSEFPRIRGFGDSIEDLALNYDSVENHGWYSNLDHTVEKLGEFSRRGDILVDYSGGTGILAKRLLDRLGSRDVGIIIVDSSPKFLRLALEKFRSEPRMAFRHIRFLREEKRLERVDEVLGAELVSRGVDGIISTNAIHLYFDLTRRSKRGRRFSARRAVSSSVW